MGDEVTHSGDRDPHERVERESSGGRKADWLGNNAMALVAVIIGIVSGAIGSWITTQVRETKTESALSHIQDTVSELKGNVKSISDTVNTAAVASGRAQSDMGHMTEKLHDESEARQLLEARTITNEKDIARIQAVLSIRK